MKKFFTTLLVTLLVQQISAVTLYDQLCMFNPNWKKYQLQNPAEEANSFNSEQQYIQTHLKQVLYILRTNPVNHLSKEQLQSRKHLIQLLFQYRIAGKFPVNYYRHKRIPVFIDEHNTHCAVGYLMQQTGNEELARRISASDNYVWVKDIRTQGVSEWQKSSGFSLEELKLIQGAYDFYMPDAFILPNKYEVPQKPACMVAYFEEGKPKIQRGKRNVWCHGEGKDGVLNGRWIQNYSPEFPWITGYYENGKRTGQWQEYYKGTNQLCRTENWRNDKLNGVRKRFDHLGNLIEEIVFKDGNAVVKINYETSLKWIRKPLDSNLVWTEVFTTGGAMIASGHEKVHNPGNLLWFQNIELTALNSIAISARTSALSNNLGNAGNLGGSMLYNTPPLVEYKKEGDWTYYKEYSTEYTASILPNTMADMFKRNYPHFGSDLYISTMMFDNVELKSSFDSIRVVYFNDQIQNLYGNSSNYTHLHISYYDKSVQDNPILKIHPYRHTADMRDQPLLVRSCGQYNQAKQRIGTWKYFDQNGKLYKTENFIIPKNEYEEELLGSH